MVEGCVDDDATDMVVLCRMVVDIGTVLFVVVVVATAASASAASVLAAITVALGHENKVKLRFVSPNINNNNRPYKSTKVQVRKW